MKFFNLFLLIITLFSCNSKIENKEIPFKQKTVGIQPYENISIIETKKIAKVIDSFYGI